VTKNVLARHIDILPTVLDVVGLPAGSYRGPGASLLARSDDSADGIVSFSEADARCVSRRAVVTHRYKYIYTPQDPWLLLLRQFEYFQDRPCEKRPECAKVPREELYDLEHDPFEEKNLLEAALPAEARTALDGLRRELDQHLNLEPAYRVASLTGARLARAPTPKIDDGVREALRALGYLE
jgi:arylsulfatase A-like enzyme